MAKIPAPLIGVNNEEPAKEKQLEETPTESGFVPLKVNLLNEREMELLRFKTDVKTVKRNTAWKKGEVKIEEIEHKHYWDSHNRAGQVNTHCVARNGHTHAMSYEISKDGKSIKTTCGPAIKDTNSPGAGNTNKRSYQPIFLYLVDDDVNGGTKKVMDTHTHTVTYMKTEKVMVRV